MKKGKAKEKLSEENRLLLLHEWAQIITALFPNKTTKNPYRNDLNKLLTSLTATEQLLHSSLVHAITLANKQSRINDHGELFSTQSDNLNALELILPPETQLNPRSVDAYTQLKEIYQDRSFTYLEACSKLKLAHSTVKRLLRPLLLFGMIEKETSPKSRRTMLRIAGRETSQSQDIFEQAQGEWKDFTGFVEF